MSARVLSFDTSRIAPIKPHSLKLEALNIGRGYADEIEQELRDFLDNVGFSKERIEALECRSRSGFISYSHNKGGLGAVAFRDQSSCCENTGFVETDKRLTQYSEQSHNEFLKDNALTEIDYDNEEMRERYDDYMRSDDTVIFSIDLMMTDDHTLNVRCTVGAKDSPYHRQFDDLLELDITFKTIKGLKQKLNRLLKHSFIKCMKTNLKEAF